MKKKIALMVTLVFVAALIVGNLLMVPPTAIAIEPFITPAPNDASWVVENRLYSPCIYTVNADGLVTDVYRTMRVEDGYQAVTSLGSDGEQLYYTRQAVDEKGRPKGGWSVWQYDSTIRQTTKLTEQPGIGVVKGISVWQSSLWVTTQDSEDAIVVYQLPAKGGIPLEADKLWLPDGKRLLQANYTASGKLSVLLDDGATIQMVNSMPHDSAIRYPYGHGLNKITTTPNAWLRLHLPLILFIFVLMLMILAIPVPFVLMCRRGHKLLHRIWAVGALGVLTTSLIAIALLLLQSVAINRQANRDASFAVAEQVANIIGQQNPTFLPAEDTENATEEQAFYSLLGAQDELLTVQDGITVIAASSKWPTGIMPNYDEATAALVEQAMQGTNAADYSVYMGQFVSVSACGIYFKGELLGVLVARTGLDIFSEVQATSLAWLAAISAAALLWVTLVLRLMLARVTAPIIQMTEKLDAISEGDLALWQPSTTHDELDGMCRAMQEMCMSLAVRDYEVDCTIRAYRRFVPMGLSKLLDRASVQEVTTGDVRTITGTIGLLSVDNRELARAELSDDLFVHFVNSCCNTLSKNLEQHSGYLLSSEFDLTASKIFFEDTNQGAIAAGLALTSRSKQSVNEIMLPNFSLLMHYTGVLYGIAGGHDKVFPFTASAELEFLQSYSEPLCQAGVRLVFTEQLVKTLDIGCKVRYIGFIASDDEQYSYKIYEVLNVHSDTQYNVRFRYTDRLQEGIQLFYRSDFYLARNIFSSLLRTAPDDGIVRWYLFACEHYFNRNQYETVDFRLFGIDKPNV